MPIQIKRIKNYPIASNSFIVFDDISKSCLIIDPGTEDCGELIDYFDKFKLVPEWIILTHEHFDHIWGVNSLKKKFSVELVCSRSCSEAIMNKKKNMSVFFNQIGFEVVPADKTIEELNYNLRWNGYNIEFIETKGHTYGSICIKIENSLFTGDTLIKNLRTVTKLPGGSTSDLKISIKLLSEKFKSKKPIVYPGHGDCFVLNNDHLITAL